MELWGVNCPQSVLVDMTALYNIYIGKLACADAVQSLQGKARVAVGFLQGQSYSRMEVWEGGMDDMHDGLSSAFRELQRGFSFGFGLLPELERHMAREMQRLYGTHEFRRIVALHLQVFTMVLLSMMCNACLVIIECCKLAVSPKLVKAQEC